jgi:hypothetical protein
VFLARRYLTGLLPIVLQFEKPNGVDLPRSLMKVIESELDVQLAEKQKTNGGSENMIVVKTFEANLDNAYAVQNRLVGTTMPSESGQPVDFSALKAIVGNSKRLVENHLLQSSMVDQWPTDCLRDPSSSKDPPMLSMPTANIIGPKSPDPEQSPIAHSLLTGAKNIDIIKKGDLWNTPSERQSLAVNREKMLLKANKATYVADESSHVRHPTGLWSGYGFSNSLPADLLKTGLKEIWEKEESVVTGKTATNRSEKTTRPEGRAIVGRGTKEDTAYTIGKGLASVREEEELSDYSTSTIPSPASTSFAMAPKTKRTLFAASTGLFESAPVLPREVIWDIRDFVAPAMVLAQLGCNEYLPQFRDQEIDMQAFLLLDEQNLKDIGVSTMGARKKIFNAILKLRESAEKYGYPV